MAVLKVETPEEAIALFERAIAGDIGVPDFEGIELGDWVDTVVHLEMGLHSEITPPFMESFLTTQTAVYRLAALIKYDAADARRLTQEDLDELQIKVKVTDGSSDILGKLAEAIGKMGVSAVGKMTPEQIVIVLLGFGILTCGTLGFRAYLDYRKGRRQDELQNEERVAALEGMQAATREQAETARAVIAAMTARDAISSKAVEAAAMVNAGLLKAASQTEESVIAGHHITRAEAKELRASARRPVTKMIVEREMRVIDINTSDAHRSVVVVEDTDGNQHRLAFADRMVEDRDLESLHASLRERTTVWLRLDVTDVGGELRINDILRVVPAPDDNLRAANEEA